MIRGPRGARSLALAAAILAAGLSVGCGTEGPVGPGNFGPPLLLGYCSNRPPSPPTNKDIYFYSVATGAQAYRPDNVDTPFDEGPLALSGDGRWMAYDTTNPLVGTFSAIVLDFVPTGTIHAPATPALFDGALNPALSYDGHYLAFQTTVGSNFEVDVVLMDAFADTLIRTPKLHQIGAIDFDPSLSGDGKLIAFTTSRTGSWDIALYDVAGDSLIPLPNCNTADSDLGVSISRDGRYLAFHSSRAGGVGLFDVYVYDRVTQSLLPMPGANTALSDINPAISPDGHWVAFTSEGEGGSDLRLYNLTAHQRFPIPGANDPYFAERFPQLADLK